MYTYINKKGKKYVLYWSEVKIKGGKKATVYYLLEESKQPSNSMFRSYRAETLPKTMEIKKQNKEEIDKIQLIYNINEEACKFFQKCIFDDVGRVGLNYITKRGLTVENIKKFIQLDTEEQKKLGNNAKKYYEQYFSRSTHMNQMEKWLFQYK